MSDYFRLSPHHDERPENSVIKLLVIHNISLPPNSFDGPWIDDLFMGRLDTNSHPYFKQLEGIRVSAHQLIRRNGEVIQYVPFDKRAWHAGISNWQGESNCNDFSVGIELEGTDDLPFTEIQYLKLAEVTKALIFRYPHFNVKSICGHSDIAPGRKTDPGGKFDWDHFFSLIEKKT
ncbi:MAG: 1,6-anhydro-N-acetylmuramyl-L-alanine amidase AmpD [Gammaproteobacteria bacterium]|nr:MAG: 1,6-anhydro-N-acetylmuramyl-L-alanine amidase AmpD [Gammaproteobacteria bacterium]